MKPSVNVSGIGMTTGYQYLALDILTQSYHPAYWYLSPSCTYCIPINTYTHSLPLLPQRQDMNVSVPPRQFSFNGPPDNLLFSSVLLVWPLAQSLPQLSTKTQDLSPLSGEGSRKEKKKVGSLWYHLNLEHIPSLPVLFILDLTQFCIWLNWENYVGSDC